MKKIAFIINDRIKKKRKIIADIETVFDSTYEKKLYITQRKGHAYDLTVEAIQDDFQYIIGVGGDGTMNEVANGYMRVRDHDLLSLKALDKIKIGILPYGSGNDLARTLKVVADFHQLRMCIDRDSFNTIDLGLVSYNKTQGQKASRYYINITDIGMGAEVARRIDKYPKWLGPNFAYQRGIISSLLTYKSQEIEVESALYQFKGKILNLVLANGKYFGSGLGIAPEASLTSNSLSVVNIGDISLLDYAKQLKYVRQCKKLNHPAIHYSVANDLHITTFGKPLPIEMDGEFIGHTPMHVKIVPAVLHLLSPKLF